MKTCCYCGMENDDDAAACVGCGTSEFSPAVEHKPSNPVPVPPRNGDHAKKGRGSRSVLGGFLLGTMALVWLVQGKDSGKWPFRAWVLFGAMVLAGFLSLGAGILSSGSTREERLRSLPATGLKVLFGLLVVAALLGFAFGIRSIFPSLDKGSLKLAVVLSMALTLGLFLFGRSLVFAMRLSRAQKRMTHAMTSARDRPEANQRQGHGPH